MCGVAEATLAISAISAAASYVGAQNNADAQADRQAAMARAAYTRYAINVQQINQQKKELGQEAAQKQMSQAVEARIAEGRSRVYFGEQGLGQMALTGNSVDTHFEDILFQQATGRARLQGDLKNRQTMLGLQADAAYASYLSTNSSYSPIFNPSPLEPIMQIASAGADYMGDGSRKYFKNSGDPMAEINIGARR